MRKDADTLVVWINSEAFQKVHLVKCRSDMEVGHSMLTLGRESGQYVVIGGNIVVQVVEVGNQLRLAIGAPEEFSIERGENWEKSHPVPECIAKARSKGAKARAR